MTATFSDNNTVTVIIPTYNAGQDFPDLLDNLETQTLKPAQIIVIDSGSNSKILEVATRRNCTFLTINRNDFNHGTTRNLAAKNVKSDFTVFLTQDVKLVHKDMLQKLIEPMLGNNNIVLSYARQLPRKHAGTLESLDRLINYPPRSLLKNKSSIKEIGLAAFFCSNSCSAIRSSAFKELNGFQENVIVNEDMLFAAKAIFAGYDIHYAAGACVYHSHPFSLAWVGKRYFNIGRYFVKHRNIFRQCTLSGFAWPNLKSAIILLKSMNKTQYLIPFFGQLIYKALMVMLGKIYQRLFSGT